MWPEISSLPTVLLSPITFLSDFMLDIVIYGKIDDIQWKFKLDSRIGGKSPVTATSATRANNHKPRKAAAQKTLTKENTGQCPERKTAYLIKPYSSTTADSDSTA